MAPMICAHFFMRDYLFVNTLQDSEAKACLRPATGPELPPHCLIQFEGDRSNFLPIEDVMLCFRRPVAMSDSRVSTPCPVYLAPPKNLRPNRTEAASSWLKG